MFNKVTVGLLLVSILVPTLSSAGSGPSKPITEVSTEIGRNNGGNPPAGWNPGHPGGGGPTTPGGYDPSYLNNQGNRGQSGNRNSKPLNFRHTRVPPGCVATPAIGPEETARFQAAFNESFDTVAEMVKYVEDYNKWVINRRAYIPAAERAVEYISRNKRNIISQVTNSSYFNTEVIAEIGSYLDQATALAKHALDAAKNDFFRESHYLNLLSRERIYSIQKYVNSVIDHTITAAHDVLELAREVYDSKFIQNTKHYVTEYFEHRKETFTAYQQDVIRDVLVLSFCAAGHCEGIEPLKIAAAARVFNGVMMVASTLEGGPGEGEAIFEGAVKGLKTNTLISKEIGVLNAEAKSIAEYWPQNGGFSGVTERTFIEPGKIIDRYGGGNFSKYFSPEGTPLSARSIPPQTADLPLRKFEVLKPIEAEAGKIAPAFGKLGSGTQYKTDFNLEQLIEGGFLKELMK